MLKFDLTNKVMFDEELKAGLVDGPSLNYIYGTDDRDFINLQSGEAEIVISKDGDDTVLAGDGNNVVYGGDGKDKLYGQGWQ